MRGLLPVDALLRAEGRFAVGRGAVPSGAIAVLVLVAGWAYGAAMGSFGGRPLQAAYSAAKVPLLLSVATCVVLANFYVVNALLGLRDDFAAALRGVLASQATVALVLAALAPALLVAYASSSDYDGAIVTNGVAFLLATLSGQVTLARHYRPLVARDPRHRTAKLAWLVLYVFVAIQLAWVLRPFIGSPGQPTRFFREGAWSNAYVVVWRKVADVVAGDGYGR